MTTVERAFEIARGGSVRTVRELRDQLSREGFEGVRAHFDGSALQKQLRVLMNAARKAPPES